MFKKSLVVAISLTAVAVWYSVHVRYESIVGWTWYKIATIVAVLVLTNAGQVWIVRSRPNRSFWARFRANVAIWIAFAVILTAEELIFRPGLASSLWHQRGDTLFFAARVALLFVLGAFANTVVGYALLWPTRQHYSGPVHV